MKCTKCNQDGDLLVAFTNYPVCGKCTRTNHSEAVGKLVKDNPSVPSEVYDIEASQEIADMYTEMFGY